MEKKQKTTMKKTVGELMAEMAKSNNFDSKKIEETTVDFFNDRGVQCNITTTEKKDEEI